MRVYLPICAATLALLVAGCGSDQNSERQVDAGPQLNRSIELTNCEDWNQGNSEERLGTIHQLETFAGGPVVGGGTNPVQGSGAVLDEKDAYKLFDSYCENSFARGFKLYKLYERAAAFTGGGPHP